MWLVLLALLTVPASASAATYVVDVTENITPEVGCTSGEPGECDLWEAIELANADGEASAIEFSVTEVEVMVALPAITQPLTIDGADEEGEPGVQLFYANEGSAAGLEVTGAGTTIEGLALSNFEPAIEIAGSENQVCNSFIGTALDGVTREANFLGVVITATGSANEIGHGCGLGNVISGNEWAGILDEGLGTLISGNLIGVDVEGETMGNGWAPAASQPAGGIIAWGEGAAIGEPGDGNVIAGNQTQVEVGGVEFGGGIVVEKPAITIRGNSIVDNQGRGIYFRFLIPQATPTLASAASAEGGATTVGGSLTGEAGTAYVVDVYANALCDEYKVGPEAFAQAGEGEEYLGTANLTTDAGGAGQFNASLPLQPEGTILTATATSEATGTTSEFSQCRTAPAVTPAPPPPPPPPAAGNPPANTSVAPPEPENGESVVVAPEAGSVFVTRPGGTKQKLTEGQTIPVGSIVNATRGKVTLTSVNRAGETQTAVFYGGIFLVVQHEGSGLVILKLRGSLGACEAQKAGKAGRRDRKAKGRKLWGSGKGNFRTEGNNGSATVRGTTWLTEDRCDGTYFKVKDGIVTIRDFAAGKTFPLGKGKSYLTKP